MTKVSTFFQANKKAAKKKEWLDEEGVQLEVYNSAVQTGRTTYSTAENCCKYI